MSDDTPRSIETFRSKDYATEATARRKLEQHATLLGRATRFIAVQNDRFFPVVIYSDNLGLNVSALIARGLTIVN